jgi:hypothetical protein
MVCIYTQMVGTSSLINNWARVGILISISYGRLKLEYSDKVDNGIVL